MTLPDNRIKLPAGEIDFDNTVGTTGQSHDLYPYPGHQPRYDHMRMYLIGLLSQQASFDEPTEYREGTVWFNLNTMALMIRLDNAWVTYADAILMEPGTTLSQFYTQFKQGTTVVTAPNGSRYRLTVDNNGTLSTVLI